MSKIPKLPKNNLNRAFELIGRSRQSGCIKTGNKANPLTRDIIKKSKYYDYIECEKDIRFGNGKKDHHRVDVFGRSDRRKEIDLIEIHSGYGHNNNTYPKDFERKYRETEKQVQHDNPNYKVTMFFLKPLDGQWPINFPVEQLDIFLSKISGKPIFFEKSLLNLKHTIIRTGVTNTLDKPAAIALSVFLEKIISA